ncbi:hypothetical protein HYALB_00009231 [Hymenoscyphus albidus]|uniref:Uncharacterized protein n=1 Tax=Hymenoscyphus albidus TaxID=595503 RepID=A0A9N9Q1N6_9HELO|nr:hypothetical protein HYALB_00009231 [Hymenoscyphus albidus]
MSKQKATYYTYNSGVECKHLHLGNLVHDFKLPTSLEPYEEKAYTDIAEPAPFWAQLTPLTNYALTLGKSLDTDLDDASDSGHEAGDQYRVVASEKSTQLEIKEPEKFFQNITLKSPTAQKWLAAHISAAESLAEKSSEGKKPEIWMLTGLILMTHATWTSLSSKDHSFIAGTQAPFDPTGISAIRRLSTSGSVRPVVGLPTPDDEIKKNISGTVIHETGKYPGTRCWAAQWTKIDVEIVAVEQAEGDADEVRLKGDEKRIAVVDCEAGRYALNGGKDGGNADEFGEEYWDEFLDATEE